MSRQQIVTNHQQICQTNTHSKNSLTQLAFPEKQVHCPFESNIFQETINPPTIINQPVIIQSSSTQIPHQALSDLHAVIDQNHNKTITLNSKYEKQPISDRNATNHRQIFVQMQQQKQKGILQDQFHQNLQQIYQQSPCSAYYQQMPQHMAQQIYNNSGICCNHYSHQLSTAQTLGQGMTSPQDVTMNQKLIQHNLPINQHNHGYPVNLKFMWPQNNKWMQTTSQNPQHLHQQSLPQWQYYYQTPTAQNMNVNQQNSKNQSQPNLLQNQTNYKSVKQQPAIAAYNQQDDEKKALQFTPEMIRDQELLVSTMRQQGISDQMMQHQFNALLNEQRRHLAYVAQFQQQEDTAEVEETQFPQKRTEKNEKPEWMMHITPPWMSYNKIERTKTQIDAKKQCLKKSQSPEKINRIIAAQEENYNLKKTEISNQVNSPQEMYLRINPHQKIVNWTCRNDHVIPYGYTGRYPYGHQQNAPNNAYCQPSSTFNNYIQYSHNIPCNHSYYSHAEQDIQAEKYNLSSSNSIDPAHFYQQNKMLTEPSSLLKMRIYKKIICPQKRNNGLQDPRTIQEALEAVKESTSRRSLHYLTNLAKKKPIIKLNGTQNPNEIPEDMRLRSPIKVTLQSGKEISANGLENTRNPNNLSLRILRSKRANKPIMMEYPRRRQNTKTCYRMQAEKENSTVAIAQQQKSHTQNARSISYNSQNALTAHHGNNAINQYANVSPQHYYQMQQCYLNRQNLTDHNGGQGDVVSMQYPNVLNANKIDRAGGDTGEKSDVKEMTKHINDMQVMQETNSQSEIRTAKTIGGITYLANKLKDGINNLTISPEKLIAYRHLQPPKIF